ncbi:hypothetical protein NM688_g4114 [Phlebia brevispora]|uniref:Uncharacterized protein n=1 Tax=Phlebia brevispora TaxID=194682 RepID=A0ACC1T3Z9_9APHY|nr:hypothetical protein NM688_g4114 [Phlebia brevispora]
MVPLTEFIAPTVGIVIPLSLMLSGVLSVQVFYYLSEYEEDSPLMKGFVIFVWLVENAQSAFCIHVIHTYISDGFEDILGIAQIIWSVGLYVGMEVLLIALIQSFYVYRAWHVGKKRWIVAVIPGVTLALRAGFGFGTAVLSYKHPTWESFREARAVKYTVNTALALGIVVDLMVALFLVYELRSEARSSPGASVPYLQTIMIYIIGTGASTFLNARKRLRNAISPAQVFDSGAASSGSGTTHRKTQHPQPVAISTQGDNIATYGDTKRVIA